MICVTFDPTRVGKRDRTSCASTYSGSEGVRGWGLAVKFSLAGPRPLNLLTS